MPRETSFSASSVWITWPSSRMALRPSCGRLPACAGTPFKNTSKRATPLRPGTILPPSRLGQRARGRAADLFVGDIELGNAERRARAVGADLPESVIGEICAALHVIDYGTIR